MSRLDKLKKIQQSIDTIVSRINNYINTHKHTGKVVSKKPVLNRQKAITQNYGLDFSKLQQLANTLFESEKSINTILENNITSLAINLKKYIIPIDINTDIELFDIQVKKINKSIYQLYDQINTIKTIEDVRKFLNKLIRLRGIIYKLRLAIFNFLYIEVRKTNKSGGGKDEELLDSGKYTIDSSRELLNNIVNFSLKKLLEDIDDLEKIIDNPIESKKGCEEQAQTVLDEYKNYIYYQSIIEKLENLLQIESNKMYLDELLGEPWFNSLDSLKTDHKWISQKLLSEKLNDETSSICKKVVNYNNNYSSLLGIRTNIINTYEDIRGAVRVYLRLNEICKPTASKCISGLETNRSSLNKLLDINYSTNTVKNRNTGEVYSGFYSIYNTKYGENSNKQMYDQPGPGQEPLKGIFDQLRNGYSNFLFGYGFSGSGKSYSLFGAGKNLGIVQYGLADLLRDGYNISLKYAFDIYGQISYDIVDGLSINSKLVHYTKTYEQDPMYKRFYTYLQDGNPKNYPILNIIDSINDIDSIVSSITKIRIENKNIKATINNPESSRGHLFLTFQIEKDGLMSYITIIDMAGIEDPIKIAEFYLKPKKEHGAEKNTISYIIDCISKPTEIKKHKLVWKSDYEKYIDEQKKTIYEILREGFFINETLHHLKHFLLEKQNKKELHEYTQDGYEITKNKIHFRTDKYDTQKLFIETNSNNKEIVLISSVLEFLESLSKNNKFTKIKPSKFIMLSVVRSNRIENDEVLFLKETLDFTKKMLSVELEKSDSTMATPASSPVKKNR